MNTDEKRTWWIVRSILALIFLAFLIAGFIVQPKDPEGTLWDRLHPMSVINFIGVVLFLITMLALAGLPQKLVDKYGWAPPGSQAPNYILFGVGILGIILIWV